MSSRIKTAVIMLTACAAVAGSCLAADLSSFPMPRTVQTHNKSGSLIIWDATEYLQKFVSMNTPTNEALDAIKYEAVKIFVDSAPALARNEHHLQVVVAFARTGAISERYQTKTFNGVQSLLSVNGLLHRGMRFPNNWKSRAQRGTYPPGIRVQMTGDLPDTQP